jgi:HEPN domain-containing protein
MSADKDAVRQRIIARWIGVADRDLRAAALCLAGPDAEPGSAAYHCQQAAEKLIKALLVASDIPFRKTHDLTVLADLAAPAWPTLGASLDGCRSLTGWGFEFRYPMPAEIAEPLPSVGEVSAVLDRLHTFRAAVDSALRDRA